MKKTIAVYPISANPPTWGHGDIMMRAANIFDHVYWVASENVSKSLTFSDQDRLKMMQIYVDYYKLENVTCDLFAGATVRYAMDKDAGILIRGLRSSTDFQGEFELSIGNRGINKNIETICMFTKPHFATISSSIVRELARLNEKIDQYVHPKVKDIIKEVFKKKNQ